MIRFPRVFRRRPSNTVVHLTVNVAGTMPTIEELQRMQREAERLSG